MTLRSLSHRAPLLGLLVAWGAGAAIAHWELFPGVTQPAWCVAALASLALAWSGKAHRRRCLVGTLLAVGAVGALRTEQTRGRLTAWDELALPAREAVLTLRVERGFAQTRASAASGLARVLDGAPHLSDLRGQLVYFSSDWPTSAGAPPLKGTTLDARGVLRPVARFPSATEFDRYLADSGVNFALDRARLRQAPAEPGAWVLFCHRAGGRLENILRTGLDGHDALADLYVAMLLGRKQELSEEQQDWFVRSGTMHLFAISGLHIAGIALAVHTLLALLRVPAKFGFVAGTALLWLYVEITGAPPSALRAFWMVTCLLASRHLRLPGNSLSALALSALGVLLIAPHQLFTASFQMSYGIVAALLLYGVPLQEKWNTRWRPWKNLPEAEWTATQRGLATAGRMLLDLVALGLAATLISTLASIGFFQLLALGGFFLNLVLIPLSTLVLFAGVASLLFGLAGASWLTIVFNDAAALLLALMQGLTRLSLETPGASLACRFRHEALFPLFTLIMLGALSLGYGGGWKRRIGAYVLPYGLLLAMLLLGVTAVV